MDWGNKSVIKPLQSTFTDMEINKKHSFKSLLVKKEDIHNFPSIKQTKIQVYSQNAIRVQENQNIP